MPSASSTATRSARLPARTSMRVPAVSPSVCMPRNSRFARRDSTAPFSSWRPRRLRPASEDELIEHCQSVARELPVIGFYLHAAVGGMALSRSFWTRFAGIDNVIAIKVAPFDRYKTLDVAVGVVAAATEDRLALYTGNDDHIIADLVTPMRIRTPGREVVWRFKGGLLGHWRVWTKCAVELLAKVQAGAGRAGVPDALLATDAMVTDCNSVIFDVANGFAGCIPGCHEVLRRQGLMRSVHCLAARCSVPDKRRASIASPPPT